MVLFESFERGSAVGVAKLVTQQQMEIQELHKLLKQQEQRIVSLEAASQRDRSVAAAGGPALALGVLMAGATFGGRALRRRSAKGGA